MTTKKSTAVENAPVTLSEEILKQLAFMQYTLSPYFIVNGIAYEGKEEDVKKEFKAQTEDMDCISDFADYCAYRCTPVEDFNDDNYFVLTDEEADEKAKEHILDSVWAFRPEFLSSFTGIDIEVFEAIANNNRCESNNPAILSMIKDEDDFVSDAISTDGRGHFLASYDNEENEETVNGQTFYIYRQN